MRVRAGTPPPFRLEPLTPAHPIAAFSCGDAAIDAYLYTRAIPEQSLGLSQVTLAVESISGAIAGFFTLSPLGIKLDPRLLTALELPPDAIPYPAVGGYLLGRMGVHKSVAGQGLGSSLVAVAVEHARKGKAETGGVFIAVDAKSDALIGWYAALGFTRLSGTSRLLMRL